MQPTSSSNKRKNLSNILVIIAMSLIVLIGIVMVLSSVSDGGAPGTNTDIKNAGELTPTPYGTEMITPFFTPTPVPTINAASITTPVPTSAPAPTAVPLDLSKMYKKGDEGNDILMIQKMLTTIGFDPGSPDGEFDSSLKKSVIEYQLYAKLDNDGIIGPSTMKQLLISWQLMAPKPFADAFPLYGITIGIDAGHQRSANANLEPISPDSTETKAKTSGGTGGTSTGYAEYVLNLQIALKLKNELEALGATVIMTRQSHDVDISNVQRAQMMNNANVDCWLRIHANGSTDKTVQGMFMLIPADGCLDTIDSRLYDKSSNLADTLLNSTLQTTGAKNLGTKARSSLTGFNWSQVPVCLIEMGHMTNEKEELRLITQAYQDKIVEGLVNGFLAYFSIN